MERITSFLAHENYVLALKFTADGTILISGGMDSVIKLWTTADWSLIRPVKAHANSVHTMAMAADESFLATGSTDCTVKIWSFPQMELLYTVQDRKKTVADVSISPDGQQVAAASYGGRVAIWTSEAKPVVAFAASTKNLTSTAFAPDGKLLAVSGLGDDIGVWQLADGELVTRLQGHKTAVGSLRFIDQGRTLVSLGYEKAVRFWDTDTWECKTEYRLFAEAQPRAVLFAPHERQAAISMEGLVQLWQVDPWELQAEIPVSTKSIGSMAYSADSQLLAIGGADKRIRVWSLD